MRLIRAICSLQVLALSVAIGAEITVEPKPFVIERSITATALPIAPTVFRMDSDNWPRFEIQKVAAHGSRVKAGDLLVEFDTEALDRQLEDSRRTLDSSSLTLAQVEVDLHALKDNLPLKLDAAKRAARNAADDLTYFKSVHRKVQEERAAESLKQAKLTLEDEQEKLRQLEKTHKPESTPEKPEDAALVYQRNAVVAAEFSVKMATLEQKHLLDTLLPREAEEKEAAAKTTALALTKTESDLPREIALKEIETANAKTATARLKADFQRLTDDRKKAEPIKAPTAGWFYHGAIEEGKWNPTETSNPLVPSGEIPAHQSFATLIPASAPLALVAFTDEGIARTLPKGGSGLLVVSGREDLSLTTTVKAVAETPDANGRYRVDLSADWPAEVTPVPGATFQVRLISYENPSAVVLPASSLKLGKDGWNVTVKLADGSTGQRPVKRGRSSGDQVEILSGLEPGQVVMTP